MTRREPATACQVVLRRLLLSVGLLVTSGVAGAAPGSYTIETRSATSLTDSTLELNCNYLNVLGELNVGNGAVKSANDITITAGVIRSQAGTINAGGSWINNGRFFAGTGTVNLTGECATAPVKVTGNNQFCNVNLGSGQDYVFPAGMSTVVNCNLDLGSGNTLVSSGDQTAFIVLGPGANVNGSANLDNVVIGLPPSARTQPVPTLSEYALMLLSLLMAIAGAVTLRRGSLSPARTHTGPES
jgi:hypothetical protein